MRTQNRDFWTYADTKGRTPQGKWWTIRLPQACPDEAPENIGDQELEPSLWEVTCQQAVVLLTEWAAKHDAMIETLDNPETAIQNRQETAANMMAPLVAAMVKAQIAGSLPPSFEPLDAARAGYEAASTNPKFDDQDRLVGFRAILDASFGSHVALPTDRDERDGFDLVKRKLERRITELGGNPNTMTAMSEASFKKNQLKSEVRNK